MESKAIDLKKSSLNWTGKKINGSYDGEIQLQSGELQFEGNALCGGKFTVDMTSLTVNDLKGEEKEKFETHLKAGDFFEVDQYPTSTLEFTQVAKKENAYGVAAKLTLKDTTKLINFDLEVTENAAKTDVVIDRTQYGIKFASGNFFDDLGDMLVYDDFHLQVNLTF